MSDCWSCQSVDRSGSDSVRLDSIVCHEEEARARRSRSLLLSIRQGLPISALLSLQSRLLSLADAALPLPLQAFLLSLLALVISSVCHGATTRGARTRSVANVTVEITHHRPSIAVTRAFRVWSGRGGCHVAELTIVCAIVTWFSSISRRASRRH